MTTRDGRLPKQIALATRAASQKAHTVAWFLRRPSLYGEFGRELVYDLSKRFRSSDGGSEQWCAERAISASNAIERLTGAPPDYNVREHYAETFAEALARARRARSAEPQNMPLAGAGDVQLLYWLARRSRAECIIETGVAYGYSSLAFLLGMSDRPSSRLISTDMPLPRTSGAYVGAAVPPELRDLWTLVVGADRHVLEGVLEQAGAIDLCHYDSDKTYSGRRWAYHRLWERLRPGGFFISDDVGDNAAFRDFCGRVRGEPVVVMAEHKYVGVLTKPDR